MQSDPLAEVRAATRARTTAKSESETRWREAIIRAAETEVQRTEIARAAEISRERLYQILGEQP